jgi:hypothetical protein
MKTVLTLYILFNISSIHCLENDWISFYKPGIIDSHRNIDNILKTSDHLLISGIFYQTLSENPFLQDIHFISEWKNSQFTALGQGVNSQVHAMCKGPDGNIYIAGEFSKAGGLPARMLAQWNGKTWKAMDGFSYGRIHSIVADSTHLYIAGIFNDINGKEYNSIAQYIKGKWQPLAEGIKLLQYNPYSSPIAKITAMCVHENDIYVIGNFDQAGKELARNIAKWDGKTWSAIGTGIIGYPKAIAVNHKGEIFVSTMQENQSILQQMPLYHWHNNKWDTIALPPYCQQINTIQAYGNDIYIGGDFRLDDDIDDMGIAKLNGITWESVQGGIVGSVQSLFVCKDTLYVGGNIKSIGTQHKPSINIAAFVLNKTIQNDTNHIAVESIDNLLLFPNPSNQQEITIDFIVKKEGLISIEIIDIKGRKIASFAEGWYNQGHQTVIWNYMKGISSGQYTCVIHHDNSITTSVFTIIQ